MFVVMKLRRWSALSVMEIPLKSPDGSVGFMEVFETQEEAEKAWGEGVDVMEIKVKEMEEQANES